MLVQVLHLVFDDGSANIPSETLAKYGLDDDNADLNFDNDDEKDDDINNN